MSNFGAVTAMIAVWDELSRPLMPQRIGQDDLTWG